MRLAQVRRVFPRGFFASVRGGYYPHFTRQEPEWLVALFNRINIILGRFS